MKKTIRITEDQLNRLLVNKSQMNESVDPTNPLTHFDTVQKALVAKGWKVNASMQSKGITELIYEGPNLLIKVRHVFPDSEYGKMVDYTIQIIVNNRVVKQYKPGTVNTNDVIDKAMFYVDNSKMMGVVPEKLNEDINRIKTMMGFIMEDNDDSYDKMVNDDDFDMEDAIDKAEMMNDDNKEGDMENPWADMPELPTGIQANRVKGTTTADEWLDYVLMKLNYKKDNDYKRTREMFSKMDKDAQKLFEQLVNWKESILYDKLFDDVRGVSDDGYSDLISDIVSRGMKFFNQVMEDSSIAQKMVDDDDYQESFSYTFNLDEQQGTITASPQKPQFPKDDRNLNDLPNTPDGGKKMTSDIGTVEILYPNGKTKSGKCWCSTKGGIVATSCDGIENHCQDATAGWLPNTLNEGMEQGLEVSDQERYQFSQKMLKDYVDEYYLNQVINSNKIPYRQFSTNGKLDYNKVYRVYMGDIDGHLNSMGFPNGINIPENITRKDFESLKTKWNQTMGK